MAMVGEMGGQADGGGGGGRAGEAGRRRGGRQRIASRACAPWRMPTAATTTRSCSSCSTCCCSSLRAGARGADACLQRSFASTTHPTAAAAAVVPGMAVEDPEEGPRASACAALEEASQRNFFVPHRSFPENSRWRRKNRDNSGTEAAAGQSVKNPFQNSKGDLLGPTDAEREACKVQSLKKSVSDTLGPYEG